MTRCERCKGTGKVKNCQYCYHDNDPNCDFCDGNGYVQCDFCVGTGEARSFFEG